MDGNEKMAALLAEFARTMLTDFPIDAILDRLVERIVDVLPVTAAGVTLMTDTTEPHYIAASNNAALQLERLQSSLRQGPCVLAYESGEAVVSSDIGTDSRFEDFAAKAAEVGMAAVFAFPLRHDAGNLGALDLFRDEAGPLDAWAMAAAQTLADVTSAYLVNAQARDESRHTAELFRTNALHDALTGLPNRVLLQQRLEHAAQRARRTNAPATVLFADLDGFKSVNDTHGHSIGDALLIAVASRLKTLIRPGDTLARISGDEFVILCEDLGSTDAVEQIAARVTESFVEPFLLRSDPRSPAVEISITASVGIAFAGEADGISEQLIADADIAMYQVKRKGGAAHQVLDLREAIADADRVELEHDLRGALRGDQLAIAYQPIVRVKDGAVIGAEALLRWTHPTRGPVPALLTIALAERSSFIQEIGDWVLRRAITDWCTWRALFPGRPLELAVNVSARQLMSAGFSRNVADTLASAEVDPGVVTLEMTESMLLEDGPYAMTVLTELKDIGVKLALDDFGTGFSSLSYLRQYPVDIVKIDRAFVADIGVAPAGGAIIEAVTNLAHVLGLCVTVEGVETVRQRDEVVAMGCDSAQGYLYAKPMSTGDFQDLLRSQAGGGVRLPAGEPQTLVRRR
ncbi:putative bifunctional diguanylate cyclase/phosphodiesterase [Planctomonas psychrotolerans]|uniref:putative bifunctional diguanylate cyclase/phosphodiesterase n=1 Tax=Planctomonas psychrotolerans TaxID=2528712 RepID=UPI00123C2755|nr:EAL domain-containing protein [Planctomonas psychrotolerans]